MVHVTKGAVLYIVIMVVVIAIGIMIVTGSSSFLFSGGERFEKLFEPGSIRFTDDVSGDAQDLVTVECGDQSSSPVYDITLKGASGGSIGVHYEGRSDEEHASLIAVIDDGTVAVPATDENGDVQRIGCSAGNSGFSCSHDPLHFRTTRRSSSDKVFLHITFWRDAQKVINFVENGQGSMTDMFEEHSNFYVGSRDVFANITLSEGCEISESNELRQQCLSCEGADCTRDVCLGTNSRCYFETAVSSCGFCGDLKSCNDIKILTGTGLDEAVRICGEIGSRCRPRGFSCAYVETAQRCEEANA